MASLESSIPYSSHSALTGVSLLKYIHGAYLLFAAWPLLASASELGPVAGDTFYKGKGDGWFWYKDPLPPVEDEPVPEPPAEIAESQPAPINKTKKQEGPQVFSVAWLRDALPKAREKAIDDPSPENMQAYYYLQRISLDKAQRFADVSRVITMSDPLIDESIRRSTSSFAANSQTKMAGDAQVELLQSLSTKVGLFFFYKANCELCLKQSQILKSFKYSSDFTIIPISLDGSFLEGNPFGSFRKDSGQAKLLGINDAPALALAIPPKTARIVSFAPIAADAIRSRILLVAKETRLISELDYKRTLPYNDTGYLLVDGMDQMPPDLINDSKKFTAFIRQQAENAAHKNKFGASEVTDSRNIENIPGLGEGSFDVEPIDHFLDPENNQTP